MQNFNTFLKTNLNENQLKAVTQKTGTLLVIAGAGSGKTRVITARIANLILNEGASASAIIALTFTNKAAKEMRDRITKWLMSDPSTPADAFAQDDRGVVEVPFVGTFHSFCLRLLKQNSHLLQIPKFTILDDDDQKKILQDIIKRNDLVKKISVDNLSFQISNLKNSLALGNAAFSFENKMLQELYFEYETQRKASKCFDFDDLIIETLNLFTKNKDFKNSFQNTVRHVLVDEYQDTSTIQHALLKQLTQDPTRTLRQAQGERDGHIAVTSLCVVGDEDQSVYSWRGANVDNIVHFKKDFPQTVTIKIEQNYRSVKPILDIANEVISNNKNRNPKKLWSEREAKNRVIQSTCSSEYQEGEMIANIAKVIHKHKKYSSMAVLYRAHYQSRAIEEALLKYSVPYKIIGGIQFYERKEIKDLLAYLKLMANPYDRVSFFRVINCPNRRLGDKFEEQFYQLWETQPLLNFKEIALKLIETKTLGKIKEDALQGFLELFKQEEVSPTKTLNTLIQSTQYFDYLKASFEPSEAESKIENVKELIRAATHFEESNVQNTVADFIQEIALLKEKMQESKEADNDIKLMSLHAAKGLEFDVVTIAGLEEGIIPSTRSIERDEALEEERRLFYVGITRAKEYLILSRTCYRRTYGQTSYQTASRFLDEVPESLTQKIDCNYWPVNQFEQYFANLFGYRSTQTSEVLTFGGTEIKPTRAAQKTWTVNRTVKHKEFGLGIIQKIDDKGNGKFTITTRFGSGIKKIDSQFLEII